ncbi:MAG: hypothetical protein EXR77_19260 [Myxococcales bacterium]|nr:hypothetical protein [Myxococcales bacterium]
MRHNCGWQMRVLGFVVVCLSGLGVGAPASAAVPTTMAASGALVSTSGGGVSDGNYVATFRLYAQETGGTALWSEPPTVLAVKNGAFAQVLGSKTALDAKTLAWGSLWLGLEIAPDPELARVPLRSVAFAARAAIAEDVDCTGCIGPAQVAPSVLKDYAKSAALAKVATSGAYTDLVGGPDLTPYALTAALAKVAQTGAYANLLNAPDLNAYAKAASLADVAKSGSYGDLLNLPVLVKVNASCGTGLVVKGIKADGSLDCIVALDPKALPKDGLDDISNGLLTNQFTDTISSATVPMAVLDNNPDGTTDTIALPDIGIAQSLTIKIDVTNSGISGITVTLIDPVGGAYVLHDKSGSGPSLKGSYPTPDKLVSGDLSKWVGANLKGNWKLKIVDSKFKDNQPDGQLNSWSIAVQTLSSKQVESTGLFKASGGFQTPLAAIAPEVCDAKTKGYIYFDTAKAHFYGCTGTGWARLDGSSGIDIMNQSWAFSVDSNTGGDPKNVADKFNLLSSSSWATYCIQSNSSTTHWLKVDYGAPRVIEAFGVAGYPGGSHKPVSQWQLQGSNNNSNWTAVWAGDTSLWTADGNGSYPPKVTIPVSSPGAYRYYRIYADNWTNGHLLVCNWAMYE